MKGIVIIPAWRRPDFLWACLERLFQADGWQDYQFLVSIDRDCDLDVPRVASSFQAALAGPGFGLQGTPIQLIDPGDHPFHGNSFNVLHAYQRAAEKTTGLIYLVEEDVFVGKGFFRYHEAAHAAAPDCFCVSACRDQNAPLPPFFLNEPVATRRTGSPCIVCGASVSMSCDLDAHRFVADTTVAPDRRLFVYERPTYQSLGVSFRAEVVKSFVQMLTPAYFAEPTETLASWFPMTKIPRAQAEQDGFIGRVLEDWVNGLGAMGAIYPTVPRAYHSGFVGYNRSGGQPLYDGTPADRGKRLLEMSSGELNQRADSRYRDLETCDLDAGEPSELKLRLLMT